MAYAALVSLAQTIDLILNHHQHSVPPQARDQLVSIHEHVNTILPAFLENLPNKTHSFDAIIREVTHVAEDIIESFVSERVYKRRSASLQSSVGQLKSEYEHQTKGKYDEHIRYDFPDKANSSEGRIWEIINVAEDFIDLLFSGQFNKSIYASLQSSVGPSESKFEHQPKGQHEHLHYNLHELKEARQEIEWIAKIVMRIKNSITAVKDARIGEPTAVSSSSRVAPVHEDAMVGFNNDVMEIKLRLCGESSKLEVVPIVGMGGIGKTTLARSVYDDQLIVERFGIRAWVSVSQDYSVQEIVSGLLVSMKGLKARNESMEDVYKNLKGRRYLVVLDDMWSVEAWDDLRMMFPDDGNGSRIVLTTRLSDVARYADSSSFLHEMRLMDDEQSWDLLRQKLFKQGRCPAELQYVGKEIARSCRGLPLAIVVISGLLSTVDPTETAWKDISENIKFAISANDEQFDKILSLSYTNLPHHLRPCFLYMGGFPEDHETRVSKLIKLWVAEGFIKPNGPNKSIEETAEEYLEDLVKRSLVFVSKRKSNGRTKSFILHDLVREMCARKAREENFILNLRFLGEGSLKTPRRLTVFLNDLDSLGNFDCTTTRTIIALEHGVRGAQCRLGCFRLLWTLDLSDAYDRKNFRSLPAEVFELFHLRYLAFNFPLCITTAMSNIVNLQTLIISSTFVPMFLLETWSLPHLRHIVVCSGFCFSLPPFSEGATFALENLQTLSVALNFVCSPEILKRIPNLKKLGISYTAHRDFEDEYQLGNLKCLKHLEILELKICKCFRRTEKVNPAFPETLKKLSLIGLRRPWEDLKIVGSLPNLEVLKLRDHAYVGAKWETTAEGFSKLRTLLIDISDLQDWITDPSHFPMLKRLALLRCRLLSEIPADIGEIPTLELIEVDDENKSLVESAREIQEYQRSFGNEDLQVHFVRKVQGERFEDIICEFVHRNKDNYLQ